MSKRRLQARASLGTLALTLATACSGGDSAPSPDATATIDASGGRLETDDGALVLEVPAGALDRPVTITARSLPDPAEENALSGTRYELGPDGTEFATPVTLMLSYSADELRSGLTPEEEPIEVAVFRGEGDSFVAQPSVNDVDSGQVTAELTSFSPYHASARASIFLPPIQLTTSGQTSDSIMISWNLPSPLPELAGGVGDFPEAVAFVVERATGSQSPPQTEDRFDVVGATRAFSRSEIASGPLTYTDQGLTPLVDDRVPNSGPQSFFTYRVRTAEGSRLGAPSTPATGFILVNGGGSGLRITSPRDGVRVCDPYVYITGDVDPGSTVTSLVYRLNGGADVDVTSSLSGTAFRFRIDALQQGSNTIEVEGASSAGVLGPTSIEVLVGSGPYDAPQYVLDMPTDGGSVTTMTFPVEGRVVHHVEVPRISVRLITSGGFEQRIDAMYFDGVNFMFDFADIAQLPIPTGTYPFRVLGGDECGEPGFVEIQISVTAGP